MPKCLINHSTRHRHLSHPHPTVANAFPLSLTIARNHLIPSSSISHTYQPSRPPTASLCPPPIPIPAHSAPAPRRHCTTTPKSAFQSPQQPNSYLHALPDPHSPGLGVPVHPPMSALSHNLRPRGVMGGPVCQRPAASALPIRAACHGRRTAGGQGVRVCFAGRAIAAGSVCWFAESQQGVRSRPMGARANRVKWTDFRWSRRILTTEICRQDYKSNQFWRRLFRLRTWCWS